MQLSAAVHSRCLDPRNSLGCLLPRCNRSVKQTTLPVKPAADINVGYGRLHAGVSLHKEDMLITTIIFALLGIGAGAIFGSAIPGTTISGLKLAFIYVPALVVATIAAVVAVLFCFAGIWISPFSLAISTIAASLFGSLLGFLWARFHR